MAPFAMAMPKAYGRFNVMSSIIAASKGTAQVVVTKEVFDGLDAASVVPSIRNELMRSVFQWTDGLLLTNLTGNSSEAQSVDTVSDFLATDFEEAMLLVGSSSQSALFAIVTPAIAKSLAAHLLTLGINVPSWSRFDLAGVTVIATDAQTSSRVSIVDAGALAMYLGEISIRSSEQASIEMSDAPTQTSGSSVNAVNQVSLFGSNSIAMLAERTAAIKPLASNAYAHLTSVGFGTLNSPANP